MTSDFHPHRRAVTRVLFHDTGEPVGTIHRDETGALVPSCERLRWIAETPIDIHLRRIQPLEDDFLDWLPYAYAGSLFYGEAVAWAGYEED